MSRKQSPTAALITAVLLVSLASNGTFVLAREQKQLVIKLDIPGPENEHNSAGGIIVADVSGDGNPDYLVTCRGHLAVYDHSGRKRWIRKTDIVVGGQSESQGLPGHHGPGVATGDVDGDGRMEEVFLTADGVLHAVGGAEGIEREQARPPVPAGAERWEVAMIADFRGTGGDRDILLQATNKSGYRMGRFLAAYGYEHLIAGKGPLWATDQFVSSAHNAAWLADITVDGRDEVLGATIFSPDGKAADPRGALPRSHGQRLRRRRAVGHAWPGSDPARGRFKSGPTAGSNRTDLEKTATNCTCTKTPNTILIRSRSVFGKIETVGG